MKKSFTCFALLALLANLAIADTDPFAGTWTLNLRKSKYPPGAAPRRMVIHMETAGDGILYQSETIDANGRSTKAEYIAGYDGREAVVKGGVGLFGDSGEAERFFRREAERHSGMIPNTIGA